MEKENFQDFNIKIYETFTIFQKRETTKMEKQTYNKINPGEGTKVENPTKQNKLQ